MVSLEQEGVSRSLLSWTVFPSARTAQRIHFVPGRICMAVWLEKGSTVARNRHLWPGAGLPVLPGRLPSSQGLSAPLQLISPEIRDFLTQRGRFANECNVYSARTAPTLAFACPCVSRLHSRNRRCERRKSGQRDKKT